MDSRRLTIEEADARIAAKPNRVTVEGMAARIKEVDYKVYGKLTICFITMINDFTVTGENACVDPANFDAEVGRTYAYQNAFEKLWPLEGYLLAEQRYAYKLIEATRNDPQCSTPRSFPSSESII